MAYNCIIQNARIIDGTGSPWYLGDVAVKDGIITEVCRHIDRSGSETIDAKGRYLCPGFIDSHTHSDFVFFVEPAAQSKIRQGVTTEVTGNCGMSGAPYFGVLKKMSLNTSYGYTPTWETVPEYLKALEKCPKTVNVAPLVGHGTVRNAVMGLEDREPTEQEWTRMQEVLAEAIDAGAFGVSIGLYFAPGAYAREKEIVGVAEIVSKHEGLVVSHIRDEGNRTVGFIPALEEFIGIGRKAGARIHISHLKAFGPDVWGVSDEVLQLLDRSRTEGIDVTCDQYPYTATGGIISADVLPTAFVQGKSPEEVMKAVKDPAQRSQVRERVGINIRKRGGPERLTLATYDADHELEGKNIQEIADERKADPTDVVLDLIGDFYGGKWTCESLSEDDVNNIIRYPYTMVGSDGSSLSVDGPLSVGNPHPRNFGAFPRVLCHFVRDKHVLRIEEAVRKMTSLPAQRFAIHNRGLLEPGKWADMVLFDLEAVRDAPFDNPKQYPSGIRSVMVNGQWVIRDEQFTGALPGRLAGRR